MTALIQGRTWVCTYNNPPQDFIIDYLEKWTTVGKASYVVGQLEQGAEGTPHIQYYLNFSTPKKLTALKKHCGHSHFSVVKMDNGAEKYCMKEDTRLEGPWSFGVKPVQRNSKTDWQEVWDNAKKGALEEIPKDILVKHYHGIKSIAKDHIMPEERKDSRHAIWYYGPAGVGKSRLANSEHPSSYLKMCNKWWDGYLGQRTIICDDVDPSHKVLGHHFKKWADPWIPFIGESKGGAISPSYDVFIVTSQYTIDEIFDDVATREALHRRFKQVRVGDPFGVNRPASE